VSLENMDSTTLKHMEEFSSRLEIITDQAGVSMKSDYATYFWSFGLSHISNFSTRDLHSPRLMGSSVQLCGLGSVDLMQVMFKANCRSL